MITKNAFYFSRILKSRMLTEDDRYLGRVVDFVVDAASQRPRVVAVEVKRRGRTAYLDFSSCRVARVAQRYHVIASDEPRRLPEPPQPGLRLRRQVLDQQIVDVDGRKLVRVNDLVLEMVKGGTVLAAVDVGAEGLLRRLGVAKQATTVARALGRAVPSKLILWDEVETLEPRSMSLKLSKSRSKLATFHPSDLADILEELDRGSQLAIFTALDEERAADVLEELEPAAQQDLIENLPLGKAADVLEKMPADEAADILDDLAEDKAEELLQEMEKASSAEVRSLLQYHERAVGSFMSTDFLGFPAGTTVASLLAELRRLKPAADTIYYLYVLDAAGGYRATVPLRDVVVAEPEATLQAIMDEEVEALRDEDDIYSIAELLLKYKLHAVPVVNAGGKMVGTIIIEDVLDFVLRERKRK